MKTFKDHSLVALETKNLLWSQVFTVAPLIVVGSKEGEDYNLATKHMATPIGDRHFGFVCTPKHRTYHNIKKEGYFTVSFPRPDQIVLASLAAMPRCEDVNGGEKSIISSMPTFRSENLDALFIEDAYLYLECSLHQINDNFNDFSFISGVVENAFVNEDSFRASEKDEQQMVFNAPLLAYLAPGRFAKIQESYAFPFPKDYEHLIK